MSDPCSKETNDKVMARIEQELSVEKVCDKYNALLDEVEHLTHAVNDRDCEIERLRKFAKRGPYDESAASRAMRLQARVVALEARLREEIMESYDNLTSTRQARYSGPEEYADAVLLAEQEVSDE